MTRRFWALTVAAILFGGPVAAATCQVMCAADANSAMAGHGHHHSCTQPQPAAALTIDGVPHGCDHQGSTEAIALLQAVTGFSTPAVLDLTAFASAPPRGIGVAFHAEPTDIRPPGSLALTSQLRV